MSKRRKPIKNNESLIDLSVILRYFLLYILCAGAAYIIKVIVQYANSVSPTGETGNGILRFAEVHNTGAAFNLFSGQSEMIIIASFITVCALTFIAIFVSGKLTQSAASAMGSVAAGITMNMIERMQYGYVIDYIHVENSNLPVFNTADILIVIGALVLLLSILVTRR